jgi:hypothetical protein
VSIQELDTLPYEEFQSQDRPTWKPGCSYAHSDIVRLPNKKYAIQNDIHISEPDLTEDKLLRREQRFMENSTSCRMTMTILSACD